MHLAIGDWRRSAGDSIWKKKMETDACFWQQREAQMERDRNIWREKQESQEYSEYHGKRNPESRASRAPN